MSRSRAAAWELPQEMQFLSSFRPAFTAPSFARFLLLTLAAIVTMGRRTVSRLLWTVSSLLDGHPSSYHRFVSKRRWSMPLLSAALARMVVALVDENEAVLVAGDDTTAEHRGKKVFGKACHRDAVRSSSGGGKHVARKWGHKWVVLAIVVRLPFCSRPWALPVMSALYLAPKGVDRRARHKTPAQLARGMLAHLMRLFPRRRFIFLGDGGFSGHELAAFAFRHRRRLTLVGRLRGDANLYALPMAHQRRSHSRTGRRYKTHKLSSPQQTADAVADHGWLTTLRWYGNSVRDVRLSSACGGWYSVRQPGPMSVVPIRWVSVYDPASKRQDFFYCTDVTLPPARVVELFTARWSIEVTFEEAKAHLGFEDTRQRLGASVLRTAPCLLGLFSVVTLTFLRLWQDGYHAKPRQMPCYAKAEVTFSDALFAVRALIWERVLMQRALGASFVTTIPPEARTILLTYLSSAA